MEAIQFVGVASSVAAALFTILIGLLSWLGGKAFSQLEELKTSIDGLKDELHERINKIDRRVTRVETIVEQKV